MDALRGKTSQDDVAYEARRHGAPAKLTGSWISALRKGTRPLTMDVLRGIAGALGVPPETFAEYQLAEARRQLDEREIGLDQAVANLRRLEVDSPAAAEILLPPPPERLQRELEDRPRASAGADGSASPASRRSKRSARKRAT